jgi:hypothetical protein
MTSTIAEMLPSSQAKTGFRAAAGHVFWHVGAVNAVPRLIFEHNVH